MRKLFCIAAIMLLVFIFACCGGHDDGNDCLSYEEKAFEGVFEVSTAELSFTACVKGAEWQRDGGERRDVRIEFTSPRTLRGIVVTRSGGKTAVSLDGIVFEEQGGRDTFAQLSEFTCLFELTLVPISFDIEGEDTRATFKDEYGRELLLLLGKNGLPKEITDGRTTVRVISYDMIE